MADIPFDVSCKFKMCIFKIALIINKNERFVLVYVLGICLMKHYRRNDRQTDRQTDRRADCFKPLYVVNSILKHVLFIPYLVKVREN